MKRKSDWQTQLHKYLNEAATYTFAWGTHDCCLLVADAINAMTGTDLAAPYRGKYTDAASAVKLIGDTCNGKTAIDLWTYVATQNSIKQLPSVLFAQRGDVVSLSDNTIGFVYLDGKHVVAYAQDDKLHLVDVSTGLAAWRI